MTDTDEKTDTNTNKNTNEHTLTQVELEAKLKTDFAGLSDSNITILANYLHKNPKKWRSDNQFFVTDVNKLIPEAFAYNMRPSNLLFGAIITILIFMLVGIMWWVITLFIKKNNKNVVNDPGFVNTNFI